MWEEETFIARLNMNIDQASARLEKASKSGTLTPAHAFGEIQGLLLNLQANNGEIRDACKRLSDALEPDRMAWGTRFMPPKG